ncbi:hypothetical protein OAS39_12650 [Pirellulales bacterium]|nr:hypothetical protein [Pirellulales bacterium]
MRIATLLLSAGVAFTASSARGELTVVETEGDDGRLVTYKMSVTPAAEPVPALKHRLRLREIDLKQGNAAPYYYRALLDAAEVRRKIHDQYGDEYHTWYAAEDTPLDKIPLEKVREAVGRWLGPMTHLRVATSRRRCNWEWNIEEIRGPDLIAFYLSEIQESRSLARALMLQARLALAEGRFDDALDILRINYRLARDVAKEPLLVCDLIGMAIAGVGHESTVELISQPGSPNLYWALTELPRPLIDIRESIRGEMSLGLRTFPFILDAETAEHSAEEWAVLLANAMLEMQSLVTYPSVVIPEDQQILTRLGVTAMSVAVYPDAKRRLIAGGMAEQRVENMPAGQVVAIDSLREYRRVADELEKWQYLPYHVVKSRKIDDPFDMPGAEGALSHGYGYALAATLLPAIESARTAEQRLVWLTDGIRTVEAIRMHAASTSKLPSSLEEIEVVPVPENPATGGSFHYEFDGKTAVLELPFSDGFAGVAYRFEITLIDSTD